MYPGCSPPCLQDFWFLGVSQYASFWQLLLAMDLAVLGMLPEASELFLSPEAGLDGFFLWVSHEWDLRDWCFTLGTGKLK